jgi:hypothetical protein
MRYLVAHPHILRPTHIRIPHAEGRTRLMPADVHVHVLQCTVHHPISHVSVPTHPSRAPRALALPCFPPGCLHSLASCFRLRPAWFAIGSAQGPRAIPIQRDRDAGGGLPGLLAASVLAVLRFSKRPKSPPATHCTPTKLMMLSCASRRGAMKKAFTGGGKVIVSRHRRRRGVQTAHTTY